MLNILNMAYTLRFFSLKNAVCYTLSLFSLQNVVCFIILTYLVFVLFTFYIQDVLKLKKNNSGAKRLKIKRRLMCLCAFVRVCVRAGFRYASLLNH